MTVPARDDETLPDFRKQLEESWKNGDRLTVTDFLAEEPRLRTNAVALLALIAKEIAVRRLAGEQPRLNDYAERFPDLADRLADLFADNSGSGSSTVDLPAGDSRPPGPPPPLPPGAEYEVVQYIASGGQGHVYKARQVSLDRFVALKVLRGDICDDAHTVRELAREAMAAARLSHSNIVQVYDCKESGGRLVLVMEYLSGGSLKARLDHLRATVSDDDPQTTAGRRSMDPEDAAHLVAALAAGAHHAHGKGIVHRDIKPGNVLFLEDGTPKLVDFGLVRFLDTDPSAASNAIRGTPCYMAPEQAAGRTRDIGPHTDVWALGVILYECLTGRVPFKGANSMETLDLVRNGLLVPPSRLRPDLPLALERICMHCLQRDPQRRPASAAELAAGLNRYLANTHLPPPPPPAPGRLAVGEYELHDLVAQFEVTSLFKATSEKGVNASIEWTPRAQCPVYKAVHRETRQEFAMRALQQGMPGSDEEAPRLLHEAETLQALSTLAGVVRFHETGRDDRWLYLVMHALKWTPLQGLLTGVPQPVRAAAALMERVARVAGAVHAAGFVHCDLRPVSILLHDIQTDGRGAILDFGKPTLVDFSFAVRRDRPASAAAGVFGSPRYMAPELANGDAGLVAPACDVHALGVIFYELLTGTRPYEGATELNVLIQLTGQDPTPPRRRNKDVPADAEAICLKCLEKNPRQRYPDGTALADDLAAYLKQPRRGDSWFRWGKGD
jgi:serine/threonine protein kinase